MVILPFTRPKWHLSGIGLFGLGSFWMGYWGWYSVTGLIFADIAINSTLRQELKLGLKVREDWRVPYMAIAPFFFGIGVAFKYAFTIRPQFVNKLLVLHPYLDISTGHSPTAVVENGPYARIDDWFVILGILLAVELSDKAKHVLMFRPLVYLGERSFSKSCLLVLRNIADVRCYQAYMLLSASSSGQEASSFGLHFTTQEACQQPVLMG